MLAHFAADLVMLDIMMPGIDGYETCRRIRSRPFGRAIQVVMVSARSSRGEQVRAYAAGADDYVVKPFDPHECAPGSGSISAFAAPWRRSPWPAVTACRLDAAAKRTRPAPSSWRTSTT